MLKRRHYGYLVWLVALGVWFGLSKLENLQRGAVGEQVAPAPKAKLFVALAQTQRSPAQGHDGEYVVLANSMDDCRDKLALANVAPTTAGWVKVTQQEDEILELRKLFPAMNPQPLQPIQLPPAVMPQPPPPPTQPVAAPELEPQALRKTYGSVVARVVRVHDGDTIIVDVPLWPSIVGEAIEVRMAHYDAPELRDPVNGALAKKATERLTELLSGNQVLLKNLRRDKFFRLLADYYVDEQNLAVKLSRDGLVRPYEGEGPKPW